MGTSSGLGTAAVALAAAAVLTACAAQPAGTAPSTTTGSSSGTAAASSEAGPDVSAELARCAAVLREQTVRSLLGGMPEVSGGKQRVTGSVTQTRCTWTAPSGRYLTIVSLDGPGLPERARTVMAGAKPVPGRDDVVYDPAKGLIVVVDERLHQVVAGGAGTAQGRVVGLRAVDAIRAGG